MNFAKKVDFGQGVVMTVESQTEGIGQELSDELLALSPESFFWRHVGPRKADIACMLGTLGFSTLREFIDSVLPKTIRTNSDFSLSKFSNGLSEQQGIRRAAAVGRKNVCARSYIGMGYHATVTPTVILRNILQNPGWYTQYTPYQPEISQGRLEALLNFQTLISELTGLPIANASMLDEATAAAEAMAMSYAAANKRRGVGERNVFCVADSCHPQTIGVLHTRAEALGYRLHVAPLDALEINEETFGVLLQYPDTHGEVIDPSDVVARAHQVGALVTVSADPMALVLLKSPGELGADIVVGSAQRFGVPMGFGGPHAAFFATKEEHKRAIPGRLVGVSIDSTGKPALRLALQTREQHIRREKATSNICTAQVLLAIMAGMYGVYHGREGLRRIARKIHGTAKTFAEKVSGAGFQVESKAFFDTVLVSGNASQMKAVLSAAKSAQINLRLISNTSLSVSFDESITLENLRELLGVFGVKDAEAAEISTLVAFSEANLRSDRFLEQPVFQRYHSETEFLRYMRKLELRDLSLCQSMIPLGSCTMKLNATTEMLPITWPDFAKLHPFAPLAQAQGYLELFGELETTLVEITGFEAVSLQPNAGSQGEYAGLLAIREYHKQRGDLQRDICLIPKSAHGTNPASAVMAGMRVVVVECDQSGNIDLADLRSKVEQHAKSLSALMVTYPSTHGVFEASIKDICQIIHDHGGQVYLDGANLNALVGLVKVAELGADVCHINLHKTFCIPHGGGGPGMGPIGVKAHLKPFLPGHPVTAPGNDRTTGAVSAAPWGSAAVLPISWMYLQLMGAEGLRRATEVAILSANYIAKRLENHYPVLYRGQGGFVAHECILDLRDLKKTAGIEVEDVAKRLMDYGFHAPTISWPVPGTMMIEPTESESKQELDRFCEALIAIRVEIREIEEGKADKADNPLKNAPHTAAMIAADKWSHPYSREQAAFPSASTRESKFWPAVGRIDSGYGDRNLVCTCADISDYS